MAWYECLRVTAIDSIMRSFNWAKQRRGMARKGMEKGVFILMNLLELAVELSSDLGHANGALLWDVNYHLRFIKCHAHSQLAFRAGQVSLPSSQLPGPSPNHPFPFQCHFHFHSHFHVLLSLFYDISHSSCSPHIECGVKCRTTVRMSVVRVWHLCPSSDSTLSSSRC